MKKILAGILVICMVMGLAACGGNDNPSNPTQSQDIVPGTQPSVTSPSVDAAKTYKKHINISLSGTISAVNPQVSSNNAADTMYKMIYNQLVGFNYETGELKPELAESWEKESLSSYVFHLRKDVKFSNGEPFTSDDVKWTFEEYPSKTEETLNSSIKNVTDKVEKIECPDDYTVRFVLKENDADFLNRMYLQSQSIFNREACEADMKEGVRIGTNGWIVTEFIAADHISFKRFDDSWVWLDTGVCPTETVTMTVKAEASTRGIAVQTGEDAATMGISLTDVAQMKNDPNVETVVYNAENVYYFFFNMKDSPVAQDENVRMAVAYALNFDELNAVMYNGLASRTYTLWGKSQYGYFNDVENKIDYNLEKAKEYMAKSNYPNGVQVKFVYHTANQASVVAVIQQQLKAIGIECEIIATDLTGMTTLFKADPIAYDMGYSGISLQTIGDRFSFIGKDNNTTNRGKYVDADLQAKFAQARAEQDDAARKQIYKEIQQFLYDLKAYIPLYYAVESTVYHKGVSGVEWCPDSKFDFSHVMWEE